MTLGLKFLRQELLQVYAECRCIKLLIKSWVSFQMMEQGEEMLFFGVGGRREVCVGVQQYNGVFANKILANFSAITANAVTST